MMSHLSLSSQNTKERKYVKIIVDGVNSNKEAKFIDSVIKLKPGVITSRMDDRLNLYFGIFESSGNLSLADFKHWISDLGYSIKCATEGFHGKGRTVQLSENDCKTKDDHIQLKNN